MRPSDLCRFDLADTTLEVSDVDATSAMLHDLCLSNGFDKTTGLQLVSFDGAFAMELGLRQATVSTLYDTILQNWIAPLPSRIPGRTRQTKERLARRIAAMVVLASIRLQRPVNSIAPGSPKRSQTGFSQNSGVELPNFPNNPGLSDSLEPLFSFLSSSQIPSSYGAAIPSLPSHPAPGTSLSQFLRITKPPPMPPNMSQLLMHLQPNTDPSAYDWDATTRAINEQLHIGDEEQVSQKDKERMKRKAERLLKRQQRERDLEKKAESQPLLFGRDAGGLRSSPVPMTMRFKAGADTSSSQAPKMMSSQSQGFGGLGMGVFQSQVEPGRHGGRPKKKMKTRMEGF
jgi:RNA polymerase I-specific transcription initiation factor RRN6